jgi:hypothetical protein
MATMAGYNPQASLLPAGGGTIQPMSGGGSGAPPPGFHPEQSMLPPAGGVIAPYRGGAACYGGKSSGACYEMQDSEPASTPTPAAATGPSLGNRMRSAASKASAAIGKAGTAAGEALGRAGTALGEAGSVIRSKLKGPPSSGTGTATVTDVPATTSSSTTSLETVEGELGPNKKAVTIFATRLVLEDPKTTDELTENQIKALSLFGLEGKAVSIADKKAILQGLYDGVCNTETDKPLIFMAQCEPLRTVIQSLALNMLERLEPQQKNKVNTLKRAKKTVVTAEQKDNGSLTISVSLPAGERGTLSQGDGTSSTTPEVTKPEVPTPEVPKPDGTKEECPLIKPDTVTVLGIKKSQSANCYCTSTVQMLYSIPEVRKAVLGYECENIKFTDDDKHPNKEITTIDDSVNEKVVCALKKSFEELSKKTGTFGQVASQVSSSSTPIDDTYVTYLMKVLIATMNKDSDKKETIGQQQDQRDLLSMILNIIRSKKVLDPVPFYHTNEKPIDNQPIQGQNIILTVSSSNALSNQKEKASVTLDSLLSQTYQIDNKDRYLLIQTHRLQKPITVDRELTFSHHKYKLYGAVLYQRASPNKNAGHYTYLRVDPMDSKNNILYDDAKVSTETEENTKKLLDSYSYVVIYKICYNLYEDLGISSKGLEFGKLQEEWNKKYSSGSSPSSVASDTYNKVKEDMHLVSGSSGKPDDKPDDKPVSGVSGTTDVPGVKAPTSVTGTIAPSATNSKVLEKLNELVSKVEGLQSTKNSKVDELRQKIQALEQQLQTLTIQKQTMPSVDTTTTKKELDTLQDQLQQQTLRDLQDYNNRLKTIIVGYADFDIQLNSPNSITRNRTLTNVQNDIIQEKIRQGQLQQKLQDVITNKERQSRASADQKISEIQQTLTQQAIEKEEAEQRAQEAEARVNELENQLQTMGEEASQQIMQERQKALEQAQQAKLKAEAATHQVEIARARLEEEIKSKDALANLIKESHQNSLNERDRQIAESKAELDETKRREQEANARIAALEERQRAMDAELTKARSNADKKNANTASAKQEVQNAKQELERIREEKETALQEAKKVKEEAVKEQRTLMNQLNDKELALQRAKFDTQLQAAQLQAQVEAAKQEITSSQTQVEEQRAKAADAERRLANAASASQEEKNKMQAELQAAKSDATTKEVELKLQQDEANRKQQELDKANAEKAQLEKSLADAKEQAERVKQDEARRHQEELQRINQQLQEATANAKTVNDQLLESAKLAAAAEAKVASLTAKSNQNNKKKVALRGQLEEAQREANTAKEAKAQLEVDKARMEEEKKTLETQKQLELEQAKGQHQQEVAALQHEILNYQWNLLQASAKETAAQEPVTALQKQLETASKNASAALSEEEKEKFKAEVALLEKQLQKQEAAVAKAKAETEALRKTLDQQKSEAEAAIADLEATKEAEKAAQEQQLGALRDVATQLEAKAKEVQAKLDAANTAQAELEKQIVAAKANANRAKSNLGLKSTDANTARAEAKQLQVQLDAKEAERTQMEAAVVEAKRLAEEAQQQLTKKTTDFQVQLDAERKAHAESMLKIRNNNMNINKDLTAAQAEVQKLQQEQEQAQAKAQRLQNEHAQALQKLRSNQQKELEQEKQRYNQELQAKQAALEEEKQRIEAAKQLAIDQARKAAQEETAVAKQQFETNAKQARNKQADAEARVKTIQKEMEALRAAQQKALFEKEQEKTAALAEKKAEYQAEVERIDQEKKNAQQKSDELAEELARAAAQVDDLQKAQQAASAQFTQEFEGLRTANEADIQRLKTEQAEALQQAEVGYQAQLTEKQAKLEAERQRIEKEKETAIQQAKNAAQATTDQAKANFKRNVEAAQAEQAKAEQRAKKIESQIATMQAEHDAAIKEQTEKANQAEAQAKESAAKLAALQAQFDASQQQVQEKQAELARIQAEMESQQSALDSATAAKAQVEANLEQLKTEQAAGNSEKVQKAEAARAAAEAARAQAEAQLVKKTAEFNEANNALQVANQNLQSQMQHATTAAQAATDQVKEMTSKLALQQEELQKLDNVTFERNMLRKEKINTMLREFEITDKNTSNTVETKFKKITELYDNIAADLNTTTRGELQKRKNNIGKLVSSFGAKPETYTGQTSVYAKGAKTKIKTYVQSKNPPSSSTTKTKKQSQKQVLVGVPLLQKPQTERKDTTSNLQSYNTNHNIEIPLNSKAKKQKIIEEVKWLDNTVKSLKQENSKHNKSGYKKREQEYPTLQQSIDRISGEMSKIQNMSDDEYKKYYKEIIQLYAKFQELQANRSTSGIITTGIRGGKKQTARKRNLTHLTQKKRKTI